MKSFMDENFLLETETARHLYTTYAKDLPILDYHCHLSPAEIRENHAYTNIAEAWLAGDHYKWRAERACGVEEKYITGEASDYEKFRAYCRVMPLLVGNPLYHWSHMELRRFFGCHLLLNEKNCDAIWKETADVFAGGHLRAQDMIKMSGVEALCTTDDPADSLADHIVIAQSGFATKVLPAFRPDKGMNIERSGIRAYLSRLGEANGVEITDLSSLKTAYLTALNRFAACGCATADHGMDNAVSYAKPDAYHADLILKKAMQTDGAAVTAEELALYQTEMMTFFASEYTQRGWVMQMHFGVLRNPNRPMFQRLGADTGFDTIHGQNSIYPLACLLNRLAEGKNLPRTILYPINPADNDAIAALCGSFCGGDVGVPRVIQGSAWWFNDNIDGMERQLRSFGNLAALGQMLGMLTDSRSFLSYPRHDYFRRIFCNLLGDFVERGRYPNDEEALALLVRRVCYENAKNYFGF